MLKKMNPNGDDKFSMENLKKMMDDLKAKGMDFSKMADGSNDDKDDGELNDLKFENGQTFDQNDDEL